MPNILSIITQITLEEKAALCIGLGPWSTTPIERLGIPPLIMTDGPHGVRLVSALNTMGAQSLPATCFPTASALASSGDVDLLRTMGQALALDVGVLLGPRK